MLLLQIIPPWSGEPGGAAAVPGGARHHPRPAGARLVMVRLLLLLLHLAHHGGARRLHSRGRGGAGRQVRVQDGCDGVPRAGAGGRHDHRLPGHQHARARPHQVVQRPGQRGQGHKKYCVI